MSKKKDYFTFATVLAISSGTLIMASGIFLNAMFSTILLQQNLLTLILNMPKTEAINGLGQISLIGFFKFVNYFTITSLFLGIIFMITSFLALYKGFSK